MVRIAMRAIHSPNVRVESSNRVSRVRDETKEFARQLRGRMTPAEKLLWAELRGNRFGVRWKRQAVVWGYIADFYCARWQVVIEVDGPIHGRRKAQDAQRDRNLAQVGLRTFRFSNEAVIERMDDVLAAISALQE